MSLSTRRIAAFGVKSSVPPRQCAGLGARDADMRLVEHAIHAGQRFHEIDERAALRLASARNPSA